jgi:hypothetical protein
VLDPAPTYYNSDFPFMNALGIRFGNGGYSEEADLCFRIAYCDQLKLILRVKIEIANGPSFTGVSDSPRTASSSQMFASLDENIYRKPWGVSPANPGISTRPNPSATSGRHPSMAVKCLCARHGEIESAPLRAPTQ